MFNWQPPDAHGVARLPNRAAFERCNKKAAQVLAAPGSVAAAPGGGVSYRLPVTRQALAGAPRGPDARTLFIGCPVGNHCAMGQKIEVRVVGVAPAPAPAPAAAMDMAEAPAAGGA